MTNEEMEPGMMTAKGIIGTVTPVLGIVVSLQDVEAWLRIGSLTIGLAVGVFTLINLVKGRKGG